MVANDVKKVGIRLAKCLKRETQPVGRQENIKCLLSTLPRSFKGYKSEHIHILFTYIHICSPSSLPRFAYDQAWKLQNTARPPNILKLSRPWASQELKLCTTNHTWYNIIDTKCSIIYIYIYRTLYNIDSHCVYVSVHHHFHKWLPFLGVARRSIQSRPCTAKRGTPESGICQDNYFKDCRARGMPSRKCQTKRPSGSTDSTSVAFGGTANVALRLGYVELRCWYIVYSSDSRQWERFGKASRSDKETIRNIFYAVRALCWGSVWHGISCCIDLHCLCRRSFKMPFLCL